MAAWSSVVMVLLLSRLDRLSCAPPFRPLLALDLSVAIPMVGEERSAASLPLPRNGDSGLLNGIRLRDGDLPGVLSASVTSPMSDSMVPLPYIIGVVGVMGPVGPYGWSIRCSPGVETANMWCICISAAEAAAAWAFFHIIRGEWPRPGPLRSGSGDVLRS